MFDEENLKGSSWLVYLETYSFPMMKSWLVLVLHLIGWDGGAYFYTPITE